MASADHGWSCCSRQLLAVLSPGQANKRAICVLFAQSASASGRQGHHHHLSFTFSFFSVRGTHLTSVLFIYHRSRVWWLSLSQPLRSADTPKLSIEISRLWLWCKWRQYFVFSTCAGAAALLANSRIVGKSPMQMLLLLMNVYLDEWSNRSA